MKPRAPVHQLCGDTQGMRGPAHAPLQDRLDIEFVRNGGYVWVLALERERRGACRDLKFVNPCERIK